MRTTAIGKTLSSISISSPAPGTRWQSIRYYLPLGLCLLLTLGLRLWLLVRTHGFIDGDEALVGIQAQHILHGELPAYFYGQPYMGSLEAYLIAALFAIAGSSTWAMRSEPILLALVLVCLTWRLAGALATAAHLPEAARRWFVIISTSFAAIPPLYDGVIEMRTWGGHIETYILILLLLLSALRLTQRWHEGAFLRETAWRWAGIGLLIGLGMWVYPLIVVALLTVLLWIAWFLLRRLLQNRLATDADTSLTSISVVWRHCALVVAAIPTFLIGFAPALIWGANHQWANILYLLNPNNEDSQNALLHQLYPGRLALLRATLTLYGRCIVPRVIGGALPNISPAYALAQASIGMIVIIISLLLVIWASLRHTLVVRQVQQLLTLPLLFAACCVCVFCLSHISAAALLFPCSRDEVGRYAAPLVLVLPFFFAAIVTAVYLSLHKSPAQEPLVDEAAVTSPPARQRSLRLIQGVLIGFVVIYLAGQAITYVRANPTYTFQSFACPIAPVDTGPILNYFYKEHIHNAWATVWIGNAIVFESNGRIAVADPRIVTVHANNRIPDDTAAVQRAQRPAVLAFALHSDAHPALLQALDAQGVAYTTARFPAVQGMDVLVVQPARTLQPSTANALGAWFYNC